MSPSGGETKPCPERGRGSFGGECRKNSTRMPELESQQSTGKGVTLPRARSPQRQRRDSERDGACGNSVTVSFFSSRESRFEGRCYPFP